MAGASALVNDLSLASSQGTNPWEQGQPSPLWPSPGIIQNLNQMWLNPGMLLETGQDFGSAQKLAALGQEGSLDSVMSEARSFMGGEGGGRLQTSGSGGADVVKRILGALEKSKGLVAPGENIGRAPEIENEFQLQRAGERFPELQTAFASGLTPESIKSIESVLGPATPGELASLTGSQAHALSEAINLPASQGGLLSSLDISKIASAAETGADVPASFFGGGGDIPFASAAGIPLSIFGAVTDPTALGKATNATSAALLTAALLSGQPELAPLAIIPGAVNFLSKIFGFGKPSVFEARRKNVGPTAQAGESILSHALTQGLDKTPGIQSINELLAALGAPTPDTFGVPRNPVAVGIGGSGPFAVPKDLSEFILGGPTKNVGPLAGIDFEFNPNRVSAGAELVTPKILQRFLEKVKETPSVLDLIQGSGDVTFQNQAASEALASRVRADAQNAIRAFLAGETASSTPPLVSQQPAVSSSGVGGTPLVVRTGGGVTLPRSSASPETLMRLGAINPQDAPLVSAALDAMKFIS